MKRSYNVYRDGDRARAFASLENARRYCEKHFGSAGITDIRELQVFGGYDSMRRLIGTFKLTGWKWAQEEG